MKLSMVYITASSQDEAKKIGEALVAERLAACVNILGEINSIYWWDQQLEKGQEIALFAKTSTDMVEKLISRVKSIHSYDCPCVVSWELRISNPDYENWLMSELSKPE